MNAAELSVHYLQSSGAVIATVNIACLAHVQACVLHDISLQQAVQAEFRLLSDLIAAGKRGRRHSIAFHPIVQCITSHATDSNEP